MKEISRNQFIKFRVSTKEKELIEENAKRSGLNVSDYVRRITLRKKIYPIYPPQLEEAYKKVKSVIAMIDNGTVFNCREYMNKIKDLIYEAYLFPMSDEAKKQIKTK